MVESRSTLQQGPTTEAEFDKFADIYSELLDDPARRRFAQDPLHFHRRKLVVIERVLSEMGIPTATRRWLDVGCGQGELLSLGANLFGKCGGCDVSPEMLPSNSALEVSRQPTPVDLPYDSGTIDFVTAVCVFHHVHGADRLLLLKEICRVLRKDGLFCLIEHNPWNPVTRGIVKRCPVDVDAELLASRTAKQLFRMSGLEAVRTEYFLFMPARMFARFWKLEGLLGRVAVGGQYAMFGRVKNA
jgi:SAM-dependent methyltransferase